MHPSLQMHCSVLDSPLDSWSPFELTKRTVTSLLCGSNLMSLAERFANSISRIIQWTPQANKCAAKPTFVPESDMSSNNG